MRSTIFTIDPSTRRLGFAVFQVNEQHKTGHYRSSGFKAFRPLDSDGDEYETPVYIEWVHRIRDITQQITQLTLASTHPEPTPVVLIELPSVFQSARGQAANNSSSILKLTGLVFSLETSIRSRIPSSNVYLIPVNRWKGTTPKEITQKRIQRHWGIPATELDHNEADAIGIGDWYIRKYMKYTPSPLT